MDKNHIQTFIALTERARTAGLIQFNEMIAVLQALESANAELQHLDSAPKIESKSGVKEEVRAKPIERKFARSKV